jgi:hypothetical protein
MLEERSSSAGRSAEVTRRVDRYRADCSVRLRFRGFCRPSLAFIGGDQFCRIAKMYPALHRELLCTGADQQAVLAPLQYLACKPDRVANPFHCGDRA